MAKLNTNVMGDLKGKIGNLSARIVDGKTAFVARPKTFNQSQSEASVNARGRFKVTAKLIKKIIAQPDLKSIWSKLYNNGKTLWNNLMKANYSKTDPDKPTVNNIIVPEGFILPFQSVTLNAESLDMEMNPLNTSANFSVEEVELSFTVFIVCHNPVDQSSDSFKIIELFKSEAAFDFSIPYSGSLPINFTLQTIAAKYQNSFVLLAAATKNNVGEIVQHSSTYSNES